MGRRKVIGAVTRDEEVLSEDDLASAVVRVAPAKSTKRSAAKAGAKRKATTEEPREALKDRTNVQATQYAGHEMSTHAAKRPRGESVEPRATAVKSGQRTVVQDSQHNSFQARNASEEEPATTMLYARQPSVRPPVTSMYRPESVRAPSAHSTYRHERGSSMDRDWKGGDVELRRQLTAKSRECESLRLRNEALEDLANNQVKSNFDKLKEEVDRKAKRADDLVAALRTEIAVLRETYSSTTSDTTSLQKQVQAMTKTRDRFAAEKDSLEGDLAELRTRLQTAEMDKAALEIKLSVARQQIGGSTIDSKSSARPLSHNTTEAQRELKMKENLYTDLTGLIIRGVKRKDGEDEYDCIQTGRNGTLHFHLSIANSNPAGNPKTPSAYEEAEFSYEPLLDESRDRNLLDILPDYLSEDICFPRNHAVKFYTKVVESMTKRVVVEEGDA